MRLSELNIREDDLDNKINKTLNQMGLRVDPSDRPTLSNTKSNKTKPDKTDAANLGKKVNDIPDSGKAKKVLASIKKIPIIGGPFRIGIWVGAAEFVNWAGGYYNYVTGSARRSDGIPSPCEQGEDYKGAEDPMIDPFIRRPDGDSYGANLGRIIYGGLGGILGAALTRLTIARAVAQMLRLISPAGGWMGVIIAIAATLTTAVGAWIVNKLIQQLPAWGRPFSDWMASGVMQGLATPGMIKLMCQADAMLDAPYKHFSESIITESAENNKRIAQIEKVFQGILDEAKQELKTKEPRLYKTLIKIMDRSARSSAKKQEKIRLQAIQQSNVV